VKKTVFEKGQSGKVQTIFNIIEEMSLMHYLSTSYAAIFLRSVSLIIYSCKNDNVLGKLTDCKK